MRALAFKVQCRLLPSMDKVAFPVRTGSYYTLQASMIFTNDTKRKTKEPLLILVLRKSRLR